MENLTHYSYACMEAMYNYTRDLNKPSLIRRLRDVEREAQNELKSEGDLWFKFSKDDTLATTISDLDTDLQLPIRHSIHQRRTEVMRKAAIMSELQVFLS